MAEFDSTKYRGVILLILDGWGISPNKVGNAINKARKPNFDHYLTNYPHCSISAAGEEAGLTWGEVGNSEVGHYNIGAGRVIWQNLARVNNAIFDNSFFRNSILVNACKQAKKNKKKVHLVGLVSQGGVHSHLDHLLALLSLVGHNGSPETCIHFIADGRDSPPKIALTDIKKIEDKSKMSRVGKICSVTGRYYAMDRDQRWKRTEAAYQTIAQGIGETATSAYEAIQKAYKKDLSDEFITPTTIVDKNNEPLGKISDGDFVIFFNFREDRMIQLARSFHDKNLKYFKTIKFEDLNLISFSKYHQGFDFPVVFPPQPIMNTLPELISNAGMKQLHIAETEKYAHVTYFLNGGKENPVQNEDRILVPSPKVATYDIKPEMSIFETVKKTGEALRSHKYQFLVINFANPDMVGHTGNFDATVKAIEATDSALKILVDEARKNSYYTLITADHGNAEEMYTAETGQISKDHTTNPVPVILITHENKKNTPSDQNQIDQFLNGQPIGVLADIAPTVLELLHIKKPAEMTGYSLTNILTL
ncbi:2,3-bisphosphoglycerate-independent phosphoglycerate mutase [Patescibacteria group bacterium]